MCARSWKRSLNPNRATDIPKPSGPPSRPRGSALFWLGDLTPCSRPRTEGGTQGNEVGDERGQRHCQTHRSKGCLPGALASSSLFVHRSKEGPPELCYGVRAAAASQGHVAWPAVGRPAWLPGRRHGLPLGWQGFPEGAQVQQDLLGS